MGNSPKLGKHVLTLTVHDRDIIVCEDKLLHNHYSFDYNTLYDFTVELAGGAEPRQDNAHDALDFVSLISRRFPYYEYYVTIADDMKNRFRT